MSVYRYTILGYLLKADWLHEGCLCLANYIHVCTPWWMYIHTNIKYTHYILLLLTTNKAMLLYIVHANIFV